LIGDDLGLARARDSADDNDGALRDAGRHNWLAPRDKQQRYRASQRRSVHFSFLSALLNDTDFLKHQKLVAIFHRAPKVSLFSDPDHFYMPETDFFAVTNDPCGPMGFAHGEELNAFLAREPRISARSLAGSDATDPFRPAMKFPQRPHPGFRHKIRPAIGEPLTEANDRRLLEK
jgi:hypothetical protein